MRNSDLNIILKNSAISLGLCDKWQNEWAPDSTQQELIDKYIKGIDFCLKRHWPSNKFIKSNFKTKLLLANGIIIDRKYSALNPRFCIVLGNSLCKIRINGNTLSQIYLRDNSMTDVFVHTNEKVLIHLFDKASLRVFAKDIYKSDTVIINHSKDSHILTAGNARVRNELDYLQ